jgi:ABC-type multidrug transport system fused ATPase/permease subunit
MMRILSGKKSGLIKSTLLKSFSLLTKKEKNNVIRIGVAHSILNLLDLLAVLCVGYLGSLAMNYDANLPKNLKLPSTFAGMPQISNFELSEKQSIVILAFIILFLFLSKTGLSILLTKRLYLFLGECGARISKSLMNTMLQNTYSFVNKKTSQENLYSLTSGVNLITTQILPTIFLLASDLVLLTLLITCIFVLNTAMATISLGFVSTLVLILYFLMYDKAEKIGAQKYQLGIESQNQVINLFSLQQEIKATNNTSFYLEKLEKTRISFSKAEAQLNFYPYLSKYIIEISLVVLTLLAALLQVGAGNSKESFGSFVIFFAALVRILPAILRVQQNFVSLKSNFPYIHPTISISEQLQAAASEQNEDLPRKDLAEFSPSVKIVNVCAIYEGSNEFSIENLSLDIDPGSIVAIVGPSGSGKSTLAELILGAIAPLSGEILISGLHTNHVNRHWPGAVAFVPQEVFIMNASVKENIVLSDRIDLKKFNESVTAANLTNYLSSLESGPDTVLEEKGFNLSGGEKQRIGIARALYSNPKLLVLDEATSSLDSENESLIMQSLIGLKGKVTQIIIAHRLSTVVNADQVVYLRKGQIVAKGSFESVRLQVPDFDFQAGLLGL